MANIKAAIKSARQDKKRRIRNVETKSEVKTSFAKAVGAIASKAKNAKELVLRAVSVIDKAAERGIVHKNMAARKKSRLLKKLNMVLKG